MHELLLFGQVPASRHNQVLNILAGISAMQPQPILEKHLVFKPNRKPGTGPAKPVGGAQDIQKAGGAQAIQAQDLFHMQLVADVKEELGKRKSHDSDDMVMKGTDGDVGAMVEVGGNDCKKRETLWQPDNTSRRNPRPHHSQNDNPNLLDNGHSNSATSPTYLATDP